ncbi:MAG: helix-turn-helix domain-containing protein [Kofleriaceae bacterium]|nr:helix-turn-helix domain-containing protein [Kofleriaceae bacterium]
MLGYWIIADLEGAHRATPVQTAPRPGAVLTINIGRPCVAMHAPTVMQASLLGVQTVARTWHSNRDCYFAMALLTLPGLARLFPGIGQAAVDLQLDLGAVLGDRDTSAIVRTVAASPSPAMIAALLDRWLLARLDAVDARAEITPFAHACRLVEAGRSIARAADAIGISTRQLERWFALHAGVGPQTVAGIARLQRSLQAAQRGSTSARDGYADQPHQVRAWRRYLAVTPGRYRTSDMADLTVDGLAHFL